MVVCLYAQVTINGTLDFFFKSVEFFTSCNLKSESIKALILSVQSNYHCPLDQRNKRNQRFWCPTMPLVDMLASQRRFNHRLDIPAVDLAVVQELQTLCDDGVPHADHMLGQVLHQAEEAALGVEPGVCAQLLVVGLQRLDHPADAELIVALGAVQRPNHQVDNAEVEDLPVRVLVGHVLLLLLNLPHQLLCLLVLTRHNVADAEIGQHNGRHVENGVKVLLDNRLVEAGGLLELVLLHEEHVGHVELPDVGLAAELDALAEDLLDLGVLVHVPVDLSLGHQDGDVLGQGVLVVVDGLLHGFVVVVVARLLYRTMLL